MLAGAPGAHAGDALAHVRMREGGVGVVDASRNWTLQEVADLLRRFPRVPGSGGWASKWFSRISSLGQPTPTLREVRSYLRSCLADAELMRDPAKGGPKFPLAIACDPGRFTAWLERYRASEAAREASAVNENHVEIPRPVTRGVRVIASNPVPPPLAELLSAIGNGNAFSGRSSKASSPLHTFPRGEGKGRPPRGLLGPFRKNPKMSTQTVKNPPAAQNDRPRALWLVFLLDGGLTPHVALESGGDLAPFTPCARSTEGATIGPRIVPAEFGRAFCKACRELAPMISVDPPASSDLETSLTDASLSLAASFGGAT
jgi:hypothetical protein